MSDLRRFRLDPGRMPIWLMLAIVALFTVASAFPAIDTECALVALGLTVGTFTVRVIIRRPR